MNKSYIFKYLDDGWIKNELNIRDIHLSIQIEIAFQLAVINKNLEEMNRIAAAPDY